MSARPPSRPGDGAEAVAGGLRGLLDAAIHGAVKGDEITFVENLDFQGNALKITYKGKISADEIKFTRNVADMVTEEFVAKRAK